MTSPARQAEADRVELVYFWALNQLANQTYIDAMDLWRTVPATRQAATAGWWLNAIIRLVMARRSQMQDLAIAYYRLTRALRTGYSVTDPVRGEGESVSLERLRDEFEAEVDSIEAEVSSPSPTSTDEGPNPELELPNSSVQDAGPAPDYTDEMYDDDEDIYLEELADLEAAIEASDRAAEEEAALVLDELGIENMLNKLAEAQKEQDALEAEKKAAEAHAGAGRRQAAAAMRITMNAARGLVYDLSSTDMRVIGWARYSRTGTPCGWCAMLISRGAIYKTRRAAQHQGARQEEDKYHDNCRCVAIPIFSEEQLESELFDLYRHYRSLWNKHIKDRFTGNDALNEWRRIVRQEQQQTTTTTAAPEAA